MSQVVHLFGWEKGLEQSEYYEKDRIQRMHTPEAQTHHKLVSWVGGPAVRAGLRILAQNSAWWMLVLLVQCGVGEALGWGVFGEDPLHPEVFPCTALHCLSRMLVYSVWKHTTMVHLETYCLSALPSGLKLRKNEMRCKLEGKVFISHM